jgi:hypothetical protein
VKYNQKQYAEAAAEFQKVLQLDPANAEAKNLLTQTQLNSASPADAVAMLQKSIAEQSAGGAKAPEDLYKRALSAAYKAKLPAAVDISRQWVADYPTPANWSDAIRIYRNFHELDDAATLDLLRLARAAGALNGEADYDRYAYAALMKGYPGEAKTVLDEGIKAGVVNPNKSPFKEEIAQAKTKSAGEEASLEKRACRRNRQGGTCDGRPALHLRPVREGGGALSRGAQEIGRGREPDQPAPRHGLGTLGRQGGSDRRAQCGDGGSCGHRQILARLRFDAVLIERRASFAGARFCM